MEKGTQVQWKNHDGSSGSGTVVSGEEISDHVIVAADTPPITMRDGKMVESQVHPLLWVHVDALFISARQQRKADAPALPAKE